MQSFEVRGCSLLLEIQFSTSGDFVLLCDYEEIVTLAGVRYGGSSFPLWYCTFEVVQESAMAQCRREGVSILRKSR